MDFEKGFYWVKVNEEITIAECTGTFWYFIGNDGGEPLDAQTVILEKIERREQFGTSENSLHKHDVSNQRELLITFYEWLDDQDYQSEIYDKPAIIDKYLGN